MTVQHLDTIIYNGKEYLLYSMPFSVFISDNQLEEKFPVLTTACWRGYYSEWKIIEDQLFLTWLGNDDENKSSSTFHIKDFFPGKDSVLADWYTGEFDLVNYTDDVFKEVDSKFLGEPFELFKTLYVEKGVIKGEINQLLEVNASGGSIGLSKLIDQTGKISFLVSVNENYLDEEFSSFQSFPNLDDAFDYLMDKYDFFNLYLKSFNFSYREIILKRLKSQDKFDSSWEPLMEGK